jgi:hypothetical protein
MSLSCAISISCLSHYSVVLQKLSNIKSGVWKFGLRNVCSRQVKEGTIYGSGNTAFGLVYAHSINALVSEKGDPGFYRCVSSFRELAHSIRSNSSLYEPHLVSENHSSKTLPVASPIRSYASISDECCFLTATKTRPHSGVIYKHTNDGKPFRSI